MEPRVLILMLMGALSVGALAAVFLMPNNSDKAKQRAKNLASRANAGKALSNSGEHQEAPKDRRKQVQESLSKIEEKSKANAKKTKVTLRQLIEQAGLTRRCVTSI